MTAITADEKVQEDYALSLKYQWQFIQRIKDQVDWFNNPEISPDYILYLRIAKRRLEP